jgi:hypothetical protein
MTDQNKTNRLSIVLNALRGIKALEDSEETDYSEQRTARRLAQHSALIDAHSFMTEPLELGRDARPEPV